MMVDLVCPDCGGIIGLTEIDDQGRSPCTCTIKTETYRDFSAGDLPSRDDTVHSVNEAEPSPQASVTTPKKICVDCGKDLNGHQRVRDSRGYLCVPCAKLEKSVEKEKVACGQCGRRVKDAALTSISGLKVCKACYEDHKNGTRRIIRPVSSKTFVEEQKRSLKVLGIVVGVFGLIVLWRLAVALL